MADFPVEDGLPTRKPRLYIIAGPNGAGKTTFVLRFLPFYADCINFVNADLIASGLSPFSPEIAAIKAGKLMLDEIDVFRRQRADFAFETTLSGKTYVTLLKEMRKAGYEVHIYFLWLRSIDLALKRVAERVAAGGHDVPAPTVLRRFERGLHNLFHLYRDLADSWILFDNSGEEPRIIAKQTNRVLKVFDGKLLIEIKKAAGIL